MNAIAHGTESHYRGVLDGARQMHLRAIKRALDAGLPADELIEDAEAFARAVRGIVAVGS